MRFRPANSLKTKMALLSFLINCYHQTTYICLSVLRLLYLLESIASYLIGHNYHLAVFLAQNKPSTCIKFWCYLFFAAPVIYYFLHPYFMPLLVPAPISGNVPDTKLIIEISLSHYIEFLITRTRARLFAWQNDISW